MGALFGLALLALLVPVAARPVLGQAPGPAGSATPAPDRSGRYGAGRPATEAEIAQVNIDVRADGQGLPAGSGSVEQGQALYTQKCAGCHGVTGREGGTGPVLVGRQAWGPDGGDRTIGNYWPYASTIYDYVSRAMPLQAPGSLKPDEVYAVTAYLLHANEVIPAGAVMDRESLPRVILPNADGFIPDPRPAVP